MLPEIVKRDTRYSSYWERPYTQWKVSSWDSFYREKYPTASNLIKILTIIIGWSMGTPTTMTFMKNNPDIKIDGFISVGGMIYLNFTKATIDPDYKFSTIAYGLNGFSNFRTFKPASDQFRAFKLGESIIVPPEYRKFEAKQFDFRDFFSSLDIPTLNLIGEKDKLITLEHSLQFANLAKNGKKIVYPPSWEGTKSVVRDITEFVSNI
ncbi:hypothetical protein RhiirC2_788070 [Rhizophagus irregularis]|uniref:Alpha/beta-hydrolase n=1 Tax=Rhizophagus irregularis TaxID=588596 RepID=A0A2N1MQX4_9GLOM|nr:hypothetical protein RhiirC2_788070 [Rhizophagus irregularis]